MDVSAEGNDDDEEAADTQPTSKFLTSIDMPLPK